MLFMPACDYIWAVARWDPGDRVWRLTVQHTHSGKRLHPEPLVGSFIDSGAASQWLSTVCGDLLDPDESDRWYP